MSKGKLILPGPTPLENAGKALLLEKARHQRVNQFLLDQAEALASPVDVQKFIVLCLRWNLPAPINGGYDNEQAMLVLLHQARITRPRTSPEEKLESALWLQSQMIPLPPSMSIVNGVLYGATYIDPTTQGGTA